ncbi:MAG: hypothetical protein GY906_05635 [bacterium]|nr:hypothetical protein [bacterium]
MQSPRRASWANECGFTTFLLVAALAVALPVVADNPCIDCHEDQSDAFRSNAHRGVVAEGARLCKACHGDGSRHMESGEAADIRGGAALADWNADHEALACLSCHGADFPAYQEVPHAGQVSCWSCHQNVALHGGTAREDESLSAERHQSWALCTQCHPAVKAQFKLQYSHPVEAGLVDCVDCHDVHGRQATTVADRQNVRATCVSCHKDQSGPYVFEHLAMDQGQGCLNCHRPHGSWNRGLLASTGNGTCLTCHIQSNFPGVGKIPHDFRLSGGASCWDCHSDVHGSNTTPDFNPRGRR